MFMVTTKFICLCIIERFMFPPNVYILKVVSLPGEHGSCQKKTPCK